MHHFSKGASSVIHAETRFHGESIRHRSRSQRPSRVYETIDLSQWIAGNPTDVLATNFTKPADLFEKFPRKDVFISSKDGP
jgi:hypothetical protein